MLIDRLNQRINELTLVLKELTALRDFASAVETPYVDPAARIILPTQFESAPPEPAPEPARPSKRSARSKGGRPSVVVDAVMKAVRKFNSPNPWTVEDLCAAMPHGMEIRRKAVADAVCRMVRCGKLSNPARGKYLVAPSVAEQWAKLRGEMPTPEN